MAESLLGSQLAEATIATCVSSAVSGRLLVFWSAYACFALRWPEPFITSLKFNFGSSFLHNICSCYSILTLLRQTNMAAQSITNSTGAYSFSAGTATRHEGVYDLDNPDPKTRSKTNGNYKRNRNKTLKLSSEALAFNISTTSRRGVNMKSFPR